MAAAVPSCVGDTKSVPLLEPMSGDSAASRAGGEKWRSDAIAHWLSVWMSGLPANSSNFSPSHASKRGWPVCQRAVHSGGGESAVQSARHIFPRGSWLPMAFQ